MLISVLLKISYVCVLSLYILPKFFRFKSLTKLFLSLAILLLLAMTMEYFNNPYNPHFPGSNKGFLLSAVFWLSLITYFILTAICFAIFFMKEWIKNERQKRVLIETQLNTELSFLKSQVNPHFLFNTLNNLFSLAQKNNNEELANGISKLSGLMRYVLYDSSVDLISVSKEITYINDFIGLYKLRYTDEELIVNFTTNGLTENTFIAPLILMPFIENAFKHGIRIEEQSIINVNLECAHKKLHFTCSNLNHSHLQDEESYGGIGLENVRRRLDLLYPGKHLLQIKDSVAQFTVHLELNL